MTLAVCILAAQGVPARVVYFPGGELKSYLNFMRAATAAPKGIVGHLEGGPDAYGANRLFVSDDGSKKLDHPIEPIFKFITLGGDVVCCFKYLPEPYVFTIPREAGRELVKSSEDRVEFFDPTGTATALPGFGGSFCMANQLSFLNQRIKIHPFFAGMRVNARVTGRFDKRVLDIFAKTIGGIADYHDKPDQESRIQPDFFEIRQRALEAYRYFAPRSIPYALQIRDSIGQHLVENMTADQFRVWVDAAISPKRLAIQNDKLGLKIKSFRKAYFDLLESSGSSRFKSRSREDYESDPLYLELGPYLQFTVVSTLPNGTEYRY